MSVLGIAGPLIVVVSLVVAAVAYVRNDRLAHPDSVAERGRTATARRDAIGFGTLTLVAGGFAALLFSWLDSFWGPTRLAFALVGVAAALGLSAAAAVVRPKAGLGGVREVVSLNLLCGVAYGVALPYLLHTF